jgi:hypothetical protein
MKVFKVGPVPMRTYALNIFFSIDHKNVQVGSGSIFRIYGSGTLFERNKKKCMLQNFTRQFGSYLEL